MKRILQFAFSISLLFCSTLGKSQTLGNIESVEYDALNHRFLVSNGNNIVVVGADGNEIEYYGSDPEANYGMEIMGSALYAIVGDDVKAFDLTSGLLVSSITITGAQFLNGMASDGDHRIWVTDFNAAKIYEIDFTDLANPSYVLVVSNTNTTPNGICYDEANNRLVFVNWGSNASIKAVDLTDYSVSTLVANAGVGNIDGIDNDNYGNFFIASWTPNRITKYNADFSLSEIITVPGGLSSPADIAYAEEIDTLVIPNSGNSTVRFVGFSPSNIEVTNENPFAFNCYPNPVTDRSVLSFVTTKAGVVKISILDNQGKIIETLLEENLPAARQKVALGELEIPSGHYIWHIENEGLNFSVPFIKQ
jgi:hypothetical protein